MRDTEHVPEFDGVDQSPAPPREPSPSAFAQACETAALAFALLGLFAVVGASALVALYGAP